MHTNSGLAHHLIVIAFTKVREIDMFEGANSKRDMLWQDSVCTREAYSLSRGVLGVDDL